MHQTSCRREFSSQSSTRCSSHPRTCVASEHDIRAAFEEIGKLDHLFVTATPPAASGVFLEEDYTAAREFGYHHRAPGIGRRLVCEGELQNLAKEVSMRNATDKNAVTEEKDGRTPSRAGDS